MYQHIKVPAGGQKITVNADFSLNVPDQPIIPYIEGDGTGLRHHAGDAEGGGRGGGQELRRQAQDPLDGGLRGREVHQDLRPRRLAARRNPARVRDYVVSIKGPLTTPVGGGIRS
jgi:isocitrate dehydrogenase